MHGETMKLLILFYPRDLKTGCLFSGFPYSNSCWEIRDYLCSI